MTTARRAEPRPGRLRGWRNGWGMALRMARREIGRDRVRTGFVWLMIFLPVAVICGLHVVIASSDMSHRDMVFLQTGGGQASLRWLGGAGGTPNWNGAGGVWLSGDGGDTPATPVPGWGETVSQQETAVAKLTGRPTLALTWSDLVRSDGQLAVVLGADLNRPEATGVAQLASGRLPATPQEVLVTAAGLAGGMPDHGTVTTEDDAGNSLDLTVVGVAKTTVHGVPDLVGLPDPWPAASRVFLLFGDRPVTWDDAVGFAGYGFETSSRYLVENPPPQVYAASQYEMVAFFIRTVISAGALLEVALVTGPAFAIGAARQRRSLALAALNGAPTAQLRRTALGQSILLGISAAVLGGLVGTGLGVAVWPVLSSNPRELHGPLEIPLDQVGMAVGLGLLAAIGSALVAGRGLGRLDLVSALRGSVRSVKASRGAPVAGAILLVLGSAAAWSMVLVQGSAQGWAAVAWLGGAIAVLIGSLLLVPALLRGAARLARSAPVSLRMALREASRQQGRAVSTVAAIMAGGIVLGVVWTQLASLNLDSARDYRADVPFGQATATYTDWERAERVMSGAVAAVAAVDSRLIATRTSVLQGWSPDGKTDSGLLLAINPGCGEKLDLIRQGYPPPECHALQSGGNGPRTSVLIGPADELITLFQLDAAQQQALRDGMLLVDTSPARPQASRFQDATTQIVAGEVTFLREGYAASREDYTTEQVPAFAITSEVLSRGASLDRFGAMISVEAARAQGWLALDWQLQIASPDGPLSPELETRLGKALEPLGFTLAVERGWQPRNEPVVWGITATLGLLAVVAAAMATVLGVAELRPFLGTFAAVGADPRLSRRLASIQAWLLGFLGTILGTGVGVLVGAPMAIMVTSHDFTITPLVGVPWELILVMVGVVPLVAALVATVSVPSRPLLVRRMA
mgnify:CR=1 FL=1